MVGFIIGFVVLLFFNVYFFVMVFQSVYYEVPLMEKKSGETVKETKIRLLKEKWQDILDKDPVDEEELEKTIKKLLKLLGYKQAKSILRGYKEFTKEERKDMLNEIFPNKK